MNISISLKASKKSNRVLLNVQIYLFENNDKNFKLKIVFLC